MEDGSCWIEVKPGRSKWFPSGNHLSVMAREGLRLDYKQDYDRDSVKMVYYRDEEGKVCIPPDPSMVPQGMEAIKIDNLRQADALAKEINDDLREKFSHDQEFVNNMDNMFRDKNGNTPREHLIRYGAKTDKGREIVAGMVEELDKAERNRQNVTCNTFFEWREN